MHLMHACDSIISLVQSLRREQSGGAETQEALMKTTLHLISLDDVLFVATVLAPVSALLTGALALVALG
jgi:hypothetical protein